MRDNFKNRYEKLSNEELIKIVGFHRNDYVAEAIEAAKEELSKRGICETKEEATGSVNVEERKKNNYIGIKIIGWYLILMGIVYFIGCISWRNIIKTFEDKFGAYCVLITCIIGFPMSIVLGVFVLKLKYWARMLMLYSLYLGIGLNILSIIIIILTNMNHDEFISRLINYMIRIGVKLVVIFYLRRKDVIEQFK